MMCKEMSKKKGVEIIKIDRELRQGSMIILVLSTYFLNFENKMRGQHWVTIKMIEESDGDVQKVFREFGVEEINMVKDKSNEI